MASPAGRNSKSSGRKYQSKPDARFYSPKPAVKELKLLKQRLVDSPTFVLDFLASIADPEKLSINPDDRDGGYKAVLNLGVLPGGDGDCLVIGRGKDALKALAIVAFHVETNDPAVMFPPDADGDEDIDW